MIGLRLSIMMFFQFFIWGAWYVTAPSFLQQIGFDGNDFGWTYAVGPIAGILTPVFVGMIADRFFPTQVVLGVMHLLAGGAMIGSTFLMRDSTPSPDMINVIFFLHMLCYFPTLSLSNTLALHTMSNPEKQFPLVRVFGTIGWIAAGWVLNYLAWGSTIEMFYLAGGAGILMGIYSLSLPHIPPPAKGKEISLKEVFGLDALVLLKNRSYLTFIISSMLICIPLAFYYQMAMRTLEQAGMANVPFKMTFGQISEILFMLVMPFFFAVLGVKWMLALGMFAWVMRYVLFAVGAPAGISWMLIFGVLLHGICYDFFFVTGQIYTDKAASPRIRGQAQGLLVLFTLGIGMLVGAKVAGYVENHYTPPESKAISKQIEELRVDADRIRTELEARGEDEQLTAELTEIKKRSEELRIESLQLIDWRTIWAIPAVGAAVILLLFLVLFRDDAAGDQKEEPPMIAPPPANKEEGMLGGHVAQETER